MGRNVCHASDRAACGEAAGDKGTDDRRYLLEW